jgi:hypothetical protein
MANLPVIVREFGYEMVPPYTAAEPRISSIRKS